jgi:hypothetical protein
MNDKELLELAAKAAGEELKYDTFGGGDNPHREYNYWNPLIDDADALRLAVKLRMDLMLYSTTKGAFIKGQQHAEQEGDDPYAATRRAIVRAAAEIGRGTE